MTTSGRCDRFGRITSRKSGAWASTSQDLLWVTAKLFRLSSDESRRQADKNNSRFVYAGIPLLLAAVWSFAIEYEGMLNLGSMPPELAGNSLADLMRTRYAVSGDLLRNLQDLIEIRNEILHPVPLPTGTQDNWPDYLRHVKQKGLLNTSGDVQSDYVMLGQIASHTLFRWAVDVTKRLYDAIVFSNAAKAPMFESFLDSNFTKLFG